MLLIRRKKKLFKQFAIMNDVRDSFIFRKMDFFLLIMTEYDGFSRLYMSGINRFFTQDHTYKGRLPYSVFSYDTDTFVVSKFVRKI